MQELRLRLIKDNKIVGEQLHCQFKNIGDRLPYYLKESLQKQGVGDDDMVTINCSDGEHWHGCYVPHDSEELGMKVDGEWWFEGDIGEHKVYGYFTLRWDANEDNHYLSLGKKGGRGRANHAKIELQMVTKRIGNIHEEVAKCKQ